MSLFCQPLIFSQPQLHNCMCQIDVLNNTCFIHTITSQSHYQDNNESALTVTHHDASMTTQSYLFVRSQFTPCIQEDHSTFTRKIGYSPRKAGRLGDDSCVAAVTRRSAATARSGPGFVRSADDRLPQTRYHPK